MAGESSSWVTIAAVASLDPGKVAGIKVGDLDIALYNVGGAYFATDNVCTHAFALLNEGYLDGDVIECPLHGGCFNVRTGEGLGAPIIRDLKTYATRVFNEEIQIEIAGKA